MIDVVTNLRRLAGPVTGIETYMRAIVSRLARRPDVRLHGMTCEPIDAAELGLATLRLRPYHGLHAGRFGSQLKKLWFDHWHCLSLARSGLEQFVFHGLDGFLPRALSDTEPAVVTVLDLGFELHPELYDRRTRFLYRAFFAWTTGRADRILAISRRTADDLIVRFGVDPARVEVVHLGVDPVFADPPPPGSRPGGEGPYFLAMGGLSPRKNTTRLVEGFRRWRGRGGRRAAYRLIIAGSSWGPGEARGTLEGTDVVVTGPVDIDVLRRLYREADALLYPSIYEGFGLPLLEAMASGTPILTSHTGSAPEIAGAAAVYVDPFDVASIAEGIEAVTTPAEGERLRAAGRERVRSFAWEATAERTAEAYRAVMDARA